MGVVKRPNSMCLRSVVGLEDQLCTELGIDGDSLRQMKCVGGLDLNPQLPILPRISLIFTVQVL